MTPLLVALAVLSQAPLPAPESAPLVAPQPEPQPQPQPQPSGTVAPAPAPVEAVPSMTPQEAENRLNEAQARLSSLDDMGARDLARPVVDDPTLPSRLRARGALVVGMAQANLGQADLAAEAFRRVLGVDPAAALPPGATPAAVAAFEQARAQVSQPPPPSKELPARVHPAQEPVLGWVRPTGVVLMVAGGAVLAAGGLVVLGAFGVNEFAKRQSDTAVIAQLTRALLPIGVLAGAVILASIPVGGLGMALFFLSGMDGPLKDRAAVATE